MMEASFMKKRLLFKAQGHPRFKDGQKLWLIFSTGALAFYCLGRYKGKGRWIKDWVHIQDRDREDGRSFVSKVDAKWVGEVEIKEDFDLYLNNVSGWL